MATIKGLFIGVDGSARIVEMDNHNMLPDLYREIGCDTVEAPDLEVDGKYVSLYIDEEGKFRQEINLQATYLWRKSWGPGDYIAGNAIIFGQPDRHGYTQSIPASTLRYFEADGMELTEA